MVNRRAAPDRGDIVWLDHDPQAGHEPTGHRPALVLSPKAYNEVTGLMLCCPMTTQVKGYPFEVALVGIKNMNSVVLSDQLRSMDWRAHNAKKAGKVGDAVVKDVSAKLNVLLK
jgi:mRNA interferase MazF